ncbi:uncharacterized protein LOC111074041 isoform X1 [Drosophila obscura]|uniref:uncharacterized protein LOC111074041 isoform X1 n=1 Tax=Drosophila obscura TaxID=7282 RepID=UPI001BB205D1|nr:uncharacterized protein LOC111074041 isoform X1 [Drosophila obscura]
MLSNSTANNESVTDLKASDEERSQSNLMMIIATLTWMLLSIITLFIYCCNYWQVLRSRPRRHQRESDSELQQSTLLSLDN